MISYFILSKQSDATQTSFLTQLRIRFSQIEKARFLSSPNRPEQILKIRGRLTKEEFQEFLQTWKENVMKLQFKKIVNKEQLQKEIEAKYPALKGKIKIVGDGEEHIIKAVTNEKIDLLPVIEAHKPDAVKKKDLPGCGNLPDDVKALCQIIQEFWRYLDGKVESKAIELINAFQIDFDELDCRQVKTETETVASVDVVKRDVGNHKGEIEALQNKVKTLETQLTDVNKYLDALQTLFMSASKKKL